MVLILLCCSCYKAPLEDPSRYVLVYSGVLTDLDLGQIIGIDSPFYQNTDLQFDNNVEFQRILIHESLKMPIYIGKKYNLYKTAKELEFYVLEIDENNE